jgi:hypothetical protein
MSSKNACPASPFASHLPADQTEVIAYLNRREGAAVDRGPPGPLA